MTGVNSALAAARAAIVGRSLLPSLAPGMDASALDYRKRTERAEIETMLGGEDISTSKPADPLRDETVFEHYTGLPDRYRVDAINAIAGWQDELTFGLADKFRNLVDLNRD